MHSFIDKLQQISLKKERRIIGLMSGTSLDGLDVALCRFSGSGRRTLWKLEEFASVSYTDFERQSLRAISSLKTIQTRDLCLWNAELARRHATVVNGLLARWNVPAETVDLLASHGHTVYHAPAHEHAVAGMPNATLQIGDGDHLASLTGIVTVSDFRQHDIVRGGEGAPLARYGDFLLFTHTQQSRVLLNIGGIANATWLPAENTRFPPLCRDTGPGNTLMDGCVRRYWQGLARDEGGRLAARGTPDEALLYRLWQHDYLRNSAANATTGLEQFSWEWVQQQLPAAGPVLSREDLLATLTLFTAQTIARAICKMVARSNGQPAGDTVVLAAGGGVHNSTLMNFLRRELGALPLATTHEIGLDPDAREALFFAALANELFCGRDPRLQLGKISLPATSHPKSPGQ